MTTYNSEYCYRNHPHPPHLHMTRNRRVMNCPGVTDATTVDKLAALIREVDGDHTLGASALAEALAERGVRV